LHNLFNEDAEGAPANIVKIGLYNPQLPQAFIDYQSALALAKKPQKNIKPYAKNIADAAHFLLDKVKQRCWQ
jgi:hypothetical protein